MEIIENQGGFVKEKESHKTICTFLTLIAISAETQKDP